MASEEAKGHFPHQAKLNAMVRQAVSTTHQDGQLPTLKNVISQMAIAQSPQSASWMISPMMFEQQIYDSLKANKQELGIALYSDEIAGCLDIEPGQQVTKVFQEEVGRILVENLPSTLQRIKSIRSRRATLHRLDVCERGIVTLVQSGRERMVIKDSYREEEPEIALYLGREKLSPRIFETNDGVIAEEFISDPSVLTLYRDPTLVGYAIGKILYELHRRGVIYDNRTRDHVLVKKRWFKEPIVRVIDLSDAYRGTDFERDWERTEDDLDKIFGNNKHRVIATNKIQEWRNLEKA